MGILKKIVHVLANLCYILVGIYALICLPMVMGYNPLVVLSGSMEPSIKTGSVIYYHKVSESDLKEGDIITFKTDTKKEYVSHRINKIENGKYETKGDANEVADPLLINYEQIVGKDSISIPYVGYYVKFANENVYLILIVAIILISEYLFSNTLDIEKKKGDQNGTKKE